MIETMRSGLESIDKIQSESALSLGMTKGQVFWSIILPQAISTSVPGIMANVIFLLKETSVFSTISLMDLMFTAKDLIGMYAKTIECLFLLVVYYLIMLLPVSINLVTRMIKTTSLVMMIGIVEVLKVSQQIIEANRKTSPNAAFGVFAVVFLLYFIVCWPISRFAVKLEKR